MMQRNIYTCGIFWTGSKPITGWSWILLTQKSRGRSVEIARTSGRIYYPTSLLESELYAIMQALASPWGPGSTVFTGNRMATEVIDQIPADAGEFTKIMAKRVRRHVEIEGGTLLYSPEHGEEHWIDEAEYLARVVAKP